MIDRIDHRHAYSSHVAKTDAWYLNRESDLGSIEKGELADLVVLDKDYFSVSDAEMRTIRPVMTVIDGEVVQDSGALGHHHGRRRGAKVGRAS